MVAGERLPILAVDDRTENLTALEAVLKPLGFELFTANSGEQALRLLLDREFALIVLDVRMPGMDGLETARLIKSRERTSDIPIVFLTASRGDLGAIVRGYGMGAVDYVLKPFDPELLRSKISVFAELGQSRSMLKRSEAFLRSAFDAAPIGKTVLDVEQRIVRVNPAFARMVNSTQGRLLGVRVQELCHPEDVSSLAELLSHASGPGDGPASRQEELSVDLRLLRPNGGITWVAPAVSQIGPTDLFTQLVLVQWVDVSARRRAEEAAAELLLEQAARTHAEGEAERLENLQRLTEPTSARTLEDVLAELARRLVELFEADAAEIEADEDGQSSVRATGAYARQIERDRQADRVRWHETELRAGAAPIGRFRLRFADGLGLNPSKREFLRQAADRISLMIRRTQLHERERRIGVELQRGLLPTQPPELPGVEIAAQFEAAGSGTEVGGDWYDTFALAGERLGVVIGDVTGSGIKAASAMGQLRSVTRAFAVGDPEPPSPAEVLMRLQRYHTTVGFAQLFTVLYLVLDVRDGTVTWANAGHLPPLLRTAGGDVKPLEGHDSMMCRADVDYRDREAVLSEGDTLVLYTDGLVERHGETIDAGIERLATAVRTGPLGPRALCDHLLEGALPTAAHAEDDVTVVVVELSSRGASPGPQPDSGPPGRRVKLRLAPDPSVPFAARRMLERAFGGSLGRDELERAKLAISELATNAVLHGQGEVTLLAELDGERLLVEVIDEGTGFEHLVRDHDFDGVGGWGLRVVDSESSRWGIHDGTTHVWFEIERRGPRVGAEQRAG